MNIQEAYKILDLAKGLGMGRVEGQFTKLKTEMETKIASTSTERLKQVYITRQVQLEEAYATLIDYFHSLEATVASNEETFKKNSDSISKHSSNSWLKVLLLTLGTLGVLIIANIFLSKKNSSNSAVDEIILIEDVNSLNDVLDFDSPSEIQEIQLNIYSIDEVSDFLGNYYRDNIYGEYNAHNYFADHVDQFINLKNITPEKINESYQMNNEFMEMGVYIRNESITVSGIVDQVQYFNFWMDFICYRKSKDKYQNCQIQIEIGLDQNKKMISYKELKISRLEFLDYYPNELGSEFIRVVEDYKKNENNKIESINVTKNIPINNQNEKTQFAEFDIEVAFAVIDDVPIFSGCENVSKDKKRDCFNEKINEHIRNEFRYPESAMEAGQQGRVFVSLIIEKDGSVNIANLRGPFAALEKEAERIIKKIPKLQPGKHQGKIVRVYLSIPITFKLG